MKQLLNNYKYIFSIVTTLFVTWGCYPHSSCTLKLRYPAPPIETSSAASLSSDINLIKFEDARKGNNAPELIGHREAAFNVSMGDVHIDNPISEIFYDAFSSELINKGYNIVDAGEDFAITGKILNFLVGTDITPVYWDVYGEVCIEVEVKKANGQITKVGPYYAKNVERTYIYPSVPIMEKVLIASINEVIVNVLSDKRFANL